MLINLIHIAKLRMKIFYKLHKHLSNPQYKLIILNNNTKNINKINLTLQNNQ